jgi:hypothetical protein
LDSFSKIPEEANNFGIVFSNVHKISCAFIWTKKWIFSYPDD